MFRVWGKLIKDNHLMKDTVICISDYEMTRTHKVYTTPEPDSQRITLWRI